MKTVFLPLLCAVSGFLTPPLHASEGGHILFEENFERRPAAVRPESFTWVGFPDLTDTDRNNGITGAESNGPRNKVLRMYVAAGQGGLPLDQVRSFSCIINEMPEGGAENRVALEFDYRNLGTASTWCRFGFRAEGTIGESGVTIAFNGSGTPGAGGLYIQQTGQPRHYLQGPAGPLENLAKDVWYRIKLEINLRDFTVRAFAENREGTEKYSTEAVSCDKAFAGRILNELVFDFVKAGSPANYRFELDNIKVELLPLN